MSKHPYLEVVAFDVYGTLLATKDPENQLKPRTGTKEFLDKCKRLELIVCTCSDGDTVNVKIDLEEAGVDLDYFDEFFKMEQGLPKDFTPVIVHYKIKPLQLLIIGDRLDRDIQPGLEQGCHAFHVPEYFDEHSEEFDISKIEI